MSDLIDRPRLTALLQERRRHRVTMVVAPTGYGKSTLLHEYLRQCKGASAVLYRVAPSQRSAIGFVRGLVAALSASLGTPALYEYVYANGGRDLDGLRDWLLQAVSPFEGTIAVDDLHVAIGDAAAAAFVARVVTESPPAIRWLLSTRSMSRLPVASWQANGDAGDAIDEADLRLTASEAVRLSRACGIVLSDQVIDHLAGVTRGWPAAFAFGVRLAAKGVAAGSVATQTQAFIDDLFAEQLLCGLDECERDFLIDTSLLPSVGTEIVAQRYGPEAQELLRALRRDTTFVALDAQGCYVYHDLLRDFLRRELRKRPSDVVEERVRWAAGVLAAQTHADAALDVAVEMEAIGTATELLERFGFFLIEAGFIDIVEGASARLEALGCHHAIIRGLRAALESLHGNYVRAEELFASAIGAAQGDLSVELRLRLAAHRLNRRDITAAWDAIAPCEPPNVCPQLRVRLLTTTACIAARSGDPEGARDALRAASGLLGELSDEARIAVIHHEIALVRYLLGDFERARSYAASAIALAERCRVAGVAARARSVLSAIAGELGNTGVQRQINHDLRALARAAHDPKLMYFALANLFDIEIEAGHLAAARVVEAQLHQFDATLFRDSEEALYPAYALRAAWEGEFGVAYSYVRGTDDALSPETRRLLRRCEIALYAAAARDVAEARRMAGVAATTFTRWGDDGRTLHSRAVTARILLALTLSLLDECREAARLLEHVRYATAVQRGTFDRLATAARAFVRARATGDDRLASPLARLRESDLGGYALLIESLRNVPALRAFGDAPSALTGAERAVLERLSRGLTSKEIAAAFGKSRYTIDTQVKSIVRKFGCRGRAEALYLARRYGMIE